VHKRQYPGVVDPPNDLEAREMLVAITAGDRLALTNLYLSYYGILANFLSQVLGCESHVADVINETFVTIWERARGFRFESKVSVWIFSIAYGHASNLVRRHTTRELVQRERGCEGQAGEPRTPIEMRGSFLRTLGRLPTEQRVVLTLCYRMRYSVREIAVITDSPLETVELRMLQGRRQLRRYLPALGNGRCRFQ
jgi:RNA polymerase sigma-70 factor (ECF subfamily)